MGWKPGRDGWGARPQARLRHDGKGMEPPTKTDLSEVNEWMSQGIL